MHYLVVGFLAGGCSGLLSSGLLATGLLAGSDLTMGYWPDIDENMSYYKSNQKLEE